MRFASVRVRDIAEPIPAIAACVVPPGGSRPNPPERRFRESANQATRRACAVPCYAAIALSQLKSGIGSSAVSLRSYEQNLPKARSIDPTIKRLNCEKTLRREPHYAAMRGTSLRGYTGKIPFDLHRKRNMHRKRIRHRKRKDCATKDAPNTPGCNAPTTPNASKGSTIGFSILAILSGREGYSLKQANSQPAERGFDMFSCLLSLAFIVICASGFKSVRHRKAVFSHRKDACSKKQE